MPAKKKTPQGMGPRKLTEGEAEVLAEQLLRERAVEARAIRVLGKQTFIERATEAELRDLIEGTAVRDAILDELRKSMTPVRPWPRTRAALRGEEEMVLLTSDWQLGTLLVNEVGDIGGAGFTTAIAEERIRRMVARTILLQQRYRTQRLTIAVGGDMVEGDGSPGSSIFKQQSGQVEHGGVISQMLNVSRIMAEVVRALAPHFESVRVCSVPGNHARVSDGSTWHGANSFDYAALEHARALCQLIPNAVWHNATTFYQFIELTGGQTAMLVHGDDMKSSSKKSMLEYAAKWKALAKRDFALLLTGHHHQFQVVTGSDVTVLVNGAVPGLSSFSVKSLSVGNEPTQVVLVVGASGIEAIHPLVLDAPRPAAGVVRAA